MSQITTMPVTAPVLPELDPDLGPALGDEILLAVAAASKPATVRGGGSTRTRAATLPTPRAWSRGGSVD